MVCLYFCFSCMHGVWNNYFSNALFAAYGKMSQRPILSVSYGAMRFQTRALISHQGFHSCRYIKELLRCSPVSLQVYQVVTVLRDISRYLIGRRIYQELICNLLVDDVLVAAGCVVRGVEERKSCRGLEGWWNGDGLWLAGLDLSQDNSVTA